VDGLSINPVKKNEFLSGSHDKTVKLWDLNKMQKPLMTMTGHKEGVWCVNYHNSGSQFVTASPEGLAKLWDTKSGKTTADLKVHTKRVRTPILSKLLGILGDLQRGGDPCCHLRERPPHGLLGLAQDYCSSLS
jgi:WD40 repeat protein